MMNLDVETREALIAKWEAGEGAQAVRQLRDLSGSGMTSCKAYLQREVWFRKLDRAGTLEELRSCLKELATHVNWEW